MAAWNVTICSSASSMFKMNSKSRVEQVLGMVPSPQVSPSTIRGGVGEHCSGDVNAQWATKRGYYAAFAEQMGDEEMEVEEEIVGGAGGVLLKKRRLTMDQVRFLESNFESENKLEPERKVQIAQRLGLQPRQVAVWFQNRRARSKTKQLERDFLAMKANYHAVQLENEKLQAEVERLTALLREGATAADHGVAEGVHGRHNETQLLTLTKVSTKTSGSSSSSYPNLQSENHAEGPATLAMQANARAEEISTASVDNEVGEEEEQLQQPCTILADVNVNVNVSASMVPRPSGATVRTVVGDSASADDAPLCLSEDFYFLSNVMQQACAHQFVDGYADSFHHDNSFFFTAFDDPWDDS